MKRKIKEGDVVQVRWVGAWGNAIVGDDRPARSYKKHVLIWSFTWGAYHRVKIKDIRARVVLGYVVRLGKVPGEGLYYVPVNGIYTPVEKKDVKPHHIVGRHAAKNQLRRKYGPKGARIVRVTRLVKVWK